MIDEASIIPYNNNWRQQRINPIQINPQIDFKGEFEMSLFYHLQMIQNDGGDVVAELDKMIRKYPKQHIDRQKYMDYFIRPIFE
jgi:hypothetical protein